MGISTGKRKTMYSSLKRTWWVSFPKEKNFPVRRIHCSHGCSLSWNIYPDYNAKEKVVKMRLREFKSLCGGHQHQPISWLLRSARFPR